MLTPQDGHGGLRRRPESQAIAYVPLNTPTMPQKSSLKLKKRKEEEERRRRKKMVRKKKKMMMMTMTTKK